MIRRFFADLWWAVTRQLFRFAVRQWCPWCEGSCGYSKPWHECYWQWCIHTARHITACDCRNCKSWRWRQGEN